ncbi:MAG: hypothetical protein Q9157_005601 [Trypethelium eluteriae]
MGANQSSTAGSASGATSVGEVKTSYYELLGVTKQASEDELKKAYRKKALESHPDRNFGKEEEATRLFAAVQAAYEVLSDPQERAWYDSHEGEILRGDDGSSTGEAHCEHNIRVTTADDIMRMIRKFHGGIQYTDSPSGFYGFLRETFEGLSREEQAAAEWENVDDIDYPSFGHKEDEYDDVVKHFYAVWSSFSTKKTFAWKDLYRLSEAPDRRVRRLMEKENKRLREDGIREFNDAVRSLVMFVRKRDPRYVPNTQTEAERQKALRDATAAQAARARAANEAKMHQPIPEWATARDPEDVEEESEEEEQDVEHFECVACRKTFKSEKQWVAHEKSKKHQKAIDSLRRKMKKENKSLNLDDDISSSGVTTPRPTEDGDEESIQEVTEKPVEDDDHEGDDESQIAAAVEETTLEKDEDDEEDDEEEDEDSVSEVDSNIESSSAENDEYASREAIEERLRSAPSLDDDTIPNDDSDRDVETKAPKVGKAAQKRAKKVAKQEAAQNEELKFKCAVCSAGFPSKTRMFQHVKDFGHAAPVSQVGKNSKKGKSKR